MYGNNGCSVASSVIVKVESFPSQPGTITVSGGSAAVCPGDLRTYTVPAVTGIRYNWIPPTGATITEGQGTNSIKMLFSSGFTSNGYLRVTASNSCGSSTARSVFISRNLPSTPGTITVTGGIASVCPGDTRTYTVSWVPGITYVWTAPRGANIISGQGSNSLILYFSADFTTNGTLSVKASNNCGTSSARSLTITRNLPSTPGAITGSNSVCKGTISSYSITPVANATEYVWSVPAGSYIQGVSNGNVINVLWGNSGGSITVRSKNNCGTSASRSLSVTVATCSATLARTEINQTLAEVFPNPTNGILQILFHNEMPYSLKIKLFDGSGKEVINRDIQLSQKNENYRLDLSSMARGWYNLRLEKGNGQSQVIKVILE